MTEQKKPEPVIILNPADNVAVARVPISEGTEITVSGHRVTVRQTITPGQKIALEPIPAGYRVRKYGEIIGEATVDIAPGEWVHTQTARSRHGRHLDR